MKFAAPLVEGRLLRRYKRFLADVALEAGGTVTAACPNTGSMMGCCEPGSRVWLSESDSPTRKYRHTWEIVESAGVKVGINTGLPNRLVREAVESGVIGELAGYGSVRAEVPFGEERSRIDLLLEDPRREPCYVEVKNVTAAVTGRVALFPDAVSERGAKHLRELMRLKARGLRAVLVFCVQRGDVDEVCPADAIDPAYGRTLREAIAAAVTGRVALFPDAVSERGAKHLRELMRLKARGLRAVLVFCVQRGDVDEVRPADAIDPAYGRTLREAFAAGVEVMAWRARVTTRAIAIDARLGVRCP